MNNKLKAKEKVNNYQNKMEQNAFEKANNLNLKKVFIQEVNINGEGVYKNDHEKICIKGTLKGEEVLAKINFTKKNFSSATAVSFIKRDNRRINPPCPYYEKCGGCDFQFLNAPEALKVKNEIIKNYFNLKNLVAHSSLKSFNYRNKASFCVLNKKIGFQKEGTKTIVEIDNCLILNPLLNKALKVFKSWLKTYEDNKISHFVVRTLNQKLLVVIVCKRKPKDLQSFISGMKFEFLEGNFGIYLNYNFNSNIILGENYEHIYGLKYLEMSFNDVDYFVHPHSFMQVNDEVKNEMYLSVLSKISKEDTVIEGYSGAGLLSSLMAKKAKKVYGVEINKSATNDANKVKRINNITNLLNLNGDCSAILPKLIKENKEAVFVIDPARSGCDTKTLSALKENKVKKIIYISCNPYTLKQNITFLGEDYEIKSFEIFDMFPQTFHVECLVEIQRK